MERHLVARSIPNMFNILRSKNLLKATVHAALMSSATNNTLRPSDFSQILTDDPRCTAAADTRPYYLDLINAFLHRLSTFGPKELMPVMETLDTSTLKTLATATGQQERWTNLNSLRIRIDPPKIVYHTRASLTPKMRSCVQIAS